MPLGSAPNMLLMRSQLAKFVAKLRLLDHGLMEAANALDLISSQIKKGKGDVSEEGEDAADMDDETVEEQMESDFVKRINFFVYSQLATHKSRNRDDYKDTMVYQARKALMSEFLGAAPAKKCQNRGCYACVIRMFSPIDLASDRK
jgi:hypothetical protein